MECASCHPSHSPTRPGPERTAATHTYVCIYITFQFCCWLLIDFGFPLSSTSPSDNRCSSLPPVTAVPLSCAVPRRRHDHQLIVVESYEISHRHSPSRDPRVPHRFLRPNLRRSLQGFHHLKDCRRISLFGRRGHLQVNPPIGES